MGKVVSLLAHKNAFDIYLDFESISYDHSYSFRCHSKFSKRDNCIQRSQCCPWPRSWNIGTVSQIQRLFRWNQGCNFKANAFQWASCMGSSQQCRCKPEKLLWLFNGTPYFLFSWFLFSLEGCANSLIVALTKVNPLQSLNDQQALAKLLADLIDFVLRFDELKVFFPPFIQF